MICLFLFQNALSGNYLLSGILILTLFFLFQLFLCLKTKSILLKLIPCFLLSLLIIDDILLAFNVYGLVLDDGTFVSPALVAALLAEYFILFMGAGIAIGWMISASIKPKRDHKPETLDNNITE